ncbi:MAG: NAD(P)H-dependent oxidoreductase, partial [Vallitaleaceae bacterium]|nr:NAD(P)H-dependent oxidoreductase [Vallitaleaceae bacterium]
MSKKVLYITTSSKPEEFSTSKTVARYMINQYKAKHPEDTVEEIDLY